MSAFPSLEETQAAIGRPCPTCGAATSGATLATTTEEVWQGIYVHQVPVAFWVALTPCQHTIDTAADWARFAYDS